MNEINLQNIDFRKSEALIKLSGKYHELYSYTLLGEVMKHHSKDFGIAVTDDLLQAFSNQTRRSMGLLKKADFDKFLSNAGASYDNWENVCENEFCRMAMRLNYSGEVNYIDNAWPIVNSIPGVKQAVSDIIISKGINSGVELSDDELQSYSNNLRRVLGLHKKEDLESYLNAINVDFDGWEKMVSAEIYSEKLLKKNITPINSEDLRLNRQITNSINVVISELVYGDFVKSQSEKLSISVNDDELQSYLNDFRRVNKLHDSKKFKIWLKANNMTMEDFEIMADLKVRIAKFQKIGNDKIDPEEIKKEVRLSSCFLENSLSIEKEKSLLQTHNVPEPNEKELQEESDSMRRVYKLHDSQSFNSYLDTNGLNTDDWQNYIEHQLQIKKIKNKLADDAGIINYLSKNKVLRKAIKDDIFNEFLKK